MIPKGVRDHPVDYSLYTHKQTLSPWAQALVMRLEAHFQAGPPRDGAHDLAHALRVAGNAQRLAEAEGLDQDVCWAAGLLHDLVYLPKNHPDSPRSGELGAQAARDWCEAVPELRPCTQVVVEAIATHSFSSGCRPTCPEGAVLQDADRLEAIGAIGLARCFATGGAMGAGLWHPEDPWGRTRDLDDKRWSLDHFARKLLGLAAAMNTAAGREMARARHQALVDFLSALRLELTPGGPAEP